VLGRSVHWSEECIEAASHLRTVILDVVVQKTDELRRLNAELMESIRYREDFLSVASHELKTPLATMSLQIFGLSKFLDGIAGSSLEKIKGKIEPIHDQMKRLVQLIDSIFDMSQFLSGKFKLSLQDNVNLSRLIEHICLKHERELLQAGSPLKLTVQPGVVGRFDPRRIEQIISNLRVKQKF
jgi:light-regulated signal transduction histidine kinase (bacteriophytochrome)